MTETLLVTRPKHDDCTEYLSAYALEIIKEANKNNINVKDFEGKNANKQEIEKYLKLKNPKLIFLNGHGNENEICGHKKEVIFDIKNANLLNNKITYARACFAGLSIGKEIVKDNDGCFIGYIFPFSFWSSGAWSAKPLNDKVASLYLEPSNEVMLGLINGKTAKESDEASKKKMIENMKKLVKQKELYTLNMLKILWSNYEGQIVLGNKNATI